MWVGVGFAGLTHYGGIYESNGPLTVVCSGDAKFMRECCAILFLMCVFTENGHGI